MRDKAKPDLMTVWVRLLRTEQRVLKAVEQRLKQESLPPLLWYDVLLELERAGADGLRQRDIQKHTLLERYNVSRLVDRLCDAGLATRRPAVDDARGAVVAITAAGRDLRKAMWPVYRQAVEDEVATKLSDEELETLARLLERI